VNRDLDGSFDEHQQYSSKAIFLTKAKLVTINRNRLITKSKEELQKRFSSMIPVEPFLVVGQRQDIQASPKYRKNLFSSRVESLSVHVAQLKDSQFNPYI
jgi:hypothetical protein